MRKTILPLFLALTGAVSLFADENPPITAGEFSFSYDKPWIRQADRPMRAGTLVYKQDGEDLKDVEVAVFYFGPRAGTIQANLDRWAGQFSGDAETKTEEKKVGDRELIYFTGKGTFQESVGGPFAGKSVERPDYTMLAAILKSEQGPVFLKMTGPNDSVEAAREAFVALAEGALKPKE